MPVTGESPALELVDVHVHFGALMAVAGVSLSVDTGRRHALLGTNGAGKTTLFSTIAGEIKPTSGVVRMFGKALTHALPEKRVRLGLGRTYQAPVLFSGLSLLENLILAVRGVTNAGFSIRLLNMQDASVLRAKALAAMTGLLNELSLPVQKLSHGQRKQLELAMALAGDPKLLLLDEPAAGLAREDRERLINIVRELPRDLTVVFVEHDMDVAMSLADDVTVMKDGRVIATGSPSEISRSQVVRQMYLGSSFDGERRAH